MFGRNYSFDPANDNEPETWKPISAVFAKIISQLRAAMDERNKGRG